MTFIYNNNISNNNSSTLILFKCLFLTLKFLTNSIILTNKCNKIYTRTTNTKWWSTIYQFSNKTWTLDPLKLEAIAYYTHKISLNYPISSIFLFHKLYLTSNNNCISSNHKTLLFHHNSLCLSNNKDLLMWARKAMPQILATRSNRNKYNLALHLWKN